jgi:hypothetical protein
LCCRVVPGSAVVADGDRVNGRDGFTSGEILCETVGEAEVPNDCAVVGAGLSQVQAELSAVARSVGIAGPVVDVLASATDELITSVSSTSAKVTEPLSVSVGVEASSVTAPFTSTTVIVGVSLVPVIVMVICCVSVAPAKSSTSMV